MFKKIFGKKSQNKTNSTFSNNHEIWFNQDEIKNHVAFFGSKAKGKSLHSDKLLAIKKEKLRQKILNF